MFSGLDPRMSFMGKMKPYILSDATGTISFNTLVNPMAQVTLTGTGRTVVWSPGIPPWGVYILFMLQDGTGSRTITTWPTSVKWMGGSAPTLTTTASKMDIATFVSNGINLYGTISLNG